MSFETLETAIKDRIEGVVRGIQDAALARIEQNDRREAERMLQVRARRHFEAGIAARHDYHIKRKTEHSLIGIQTLFSLSRITEIYGLGGGARKDDHDPYFFYYEARNDYDRLVIALRPGRILIENMVPGGSGERSTEFSENDSNAELREKLVPYQTLSYVNAFEVKERFQERGYDPWGPDVLFSVLLDSAREDMVKKYFEKSISREVQH